MIDDRFGWLGKQAQQSEPTATLLRVLWRMQFRAQIITAAIYRHPAGLELRVFLEPEEKNDLLWSELARFDHSVLEDKAAAMRDVRHPSRPQACLYRPDNEPPPSVITIE